MPLFRRLKRACLTLFNSFCFPGSWLMSQGFQVLMMRWDLALCWIRIFLWLIFLYLFVEFCHEAQLEIFKSSTLLCENFSSFIFIFSFGGGYISVDGKWRKWSNDQAHWVMIVHSLPGLINHGKTQYMRIRRDHLTKKGHLVFAKTELLISNWGDPKARTLRPHLCKVEN